MCLASCLPLGLPSVASAQEIVFSTPETALDSVQDNPIGGAAESVVDSPFISLQASREWRAFAEYDVSAAAGAIVSRAEFAGDIAVNNSVDRGTRTIEISIYRADGVVTLADFDAPTTALGSVSYAPPSDSRVSFSYDIATEVDALLAAGATHIGFRARSTNLDAPNVFSGLTLQIATLCGNGVVDSGEGCDDGEDNGPAAPCSDACMPNFADSGVGMDSGTDAAVADAAPPDATTPDAGRDTGSTPDAARDTGAPPDSGRDTSAPPADTSTPSPGGDAGCACRVTSVGSGDLTSLFIILLALGFGHRRRSAA